MWTEDSGFGMSKVEDSEFGFTVGTRMSEGKRVVRSMVLGFYESVS